MLSKKIFIGIISSLLFASAALGQENADSNEPEFLIDRSDLTQALNAKSFQLQTGISLYHSEFDSSSSNHYSLPFLIARYGISNYFDVQIKSEFDLNEYFVNGNLVNKNSQISYILIGLLYQLKQDKRILFFDQLSFLFNNSFPLIPSYNFYSELDATFTTNLNRRFSLEYSLGYGYQKNIGDYSDLYLQLEAMLTRAINCEITYFTTLFIGNDSITTQNSASLEVDILTASDYQINFTYIVGINNDYSYIGGVFVYTF